MKIRWLFSNILLLLIFLSFNNAFAKQLPLTNHSAWHIASLLNSPQDQTIAGKNSKAKLEPLTPLVLVKRDNNYVYKAYVNGGSEYNGKMIFVEDFNGRLYDIACIYDKGDKEIVSKSMGVIEFYLMNIGVDDKTVRSVMDNLKNKEGVRVSQVWTPVLDGFLTCHVGSVKDSPNKIMLVINLYSEKIYKN